MNGRWQEIPPAFVLRVPGLPAPGGSKRAVRAGGKADGKVILIDDAKDNGKWRDRVAHFAREKFPGPPLRGPLGLSLLFFVPRPRDHYGTGRNAEKLKPSAPAYPERKPDTTKFFRAAEDALTGILWADDAQIVRQEAWKDYGREPGLYLEIRILEAADRSQGH